jgi:hypothetical protein
MMYLTGLRDDYVPDGRVISQILTKKSSALDSPATVGLAACYKQLNSSVGEFATLIADTNAIESTSPQDSTYGHVVAALRWLELARDAVAGVIKDQLTAAAFDGIGIPQILATFETGYGGVLVEQATELARTTTATMATAVSALLVSRFGPLSTVGEEVGRLFSSLG